jgi:toxin ParE1/3/4
MNVRIQKKVAAKRDLIEHFLYIGADSDGAALRFLSAAEESFHALAQNPEMGVACQLQGPRATGLRRWRVTGFENYLIFYRPIKGGIDVARVLHGARDIERLFK